MNKLPGTVMAILTIATLAAAHNDDSSRKVDTSAASRKAEVYAPIAKYVAARQAEFNQIDKKRKEQLDEISKYIREQIAANNPVRLTFVCTQNSRRSHMAQLWAAVAAESYVIRASAYSGGTGATAFNPRAVAAMERAGFRIEKTSDDENPIYHVRFSENRPPLTCFSKRFDNPPNPRNGFAAIMVCSDADKACPAVPGASGRFAIPYADPKASDGKPDEAATYDERCAQIAREMLYVMSRVKG